MGRGLAAATAAAVLATLGAAQGAAASVPGNDQPTVTPIKHLVVIFPENISFDHYFGTYPSALNPPGEPAFHPKPKTPKVNGLTPELLAHNPNAANPQRLDRSEPLVCDQDHGYRSEQLAFDNGLMDKFVESTDNENCAAPHISKPGLVMDYYDGNTVTGLWNYAQRFAMSDNSYSTVFGPTVPGHLNLVSGQTHGAIPSTPTSAVLNGTVISTSVSAKFDDCPKTPGNATVEMTGRNVGDMLNAKGISWGYFAGGFRPGSRRADGTAVCDSHHFNIGGESVEDYHDTLEPFQYYKSTSNPHHLPPASVGEIGRDGQANHQYDVADFWDAVDAGTMPSVSFLKPPVYQDAHPAQSDPLDEQHFIVDTMNRLQETKEWTSTAVILAYDDSDGWYDHQMSPLVNNSQSPQDALTGDGLCGNGAPIAGYQDRCGHGPRQPLMLFSPYSKVNAVDHTMTDQTSILRFIVGDQISGFLPDIVASTRADRAFLARAVTYLVREAGIRQFLDVGTGLPTAGNTHEIAQAIAPDSRVVYVDNDPLVLVHARALLTGSGGGLTDYIEADARDTTAILDGAARSLDLAQPVAVMLLGILNFIDDDDEAMAIVEAFMDAVPPGSFLAIAHPTNEIKSEEFGGGRTVLERERHAAHHPPRRRTPRTLLHRPGTAGTRRRPLQPLAPGRGPARRLPVRSGRP